MQHPAPSVLPAGTPTFSNEVVRIFQQSCQTCHHDGDIAPFSLVDYADARAHAALIKLMTQTKQMPPWKATDGCGDFSDARVLPQSAIDTIARWVDAGAPEGDRAQLPPPLDFSSGWVKGEPDLVLKNDVAFTPPAEGDTYRCFTIPAKTTSTKYVAASDVHPGDRETVHHVLTFIDTTGVSQQLDDKDPGPGYTCFGGPGFDTTGTLGGWAPGMRPLEVPENTGFELPANSRVVIQVHYHPHHGTPSADQTELGLYFTKSKPKQLMRVLPLINQTFTIPPHTNAYPVTADFPLRVPFPMHIWFVAPHMHLLGRTMHVQMQPLGADASCLIRIDDWAFNWQTVYRYKEGLAVPANTRLWATATYDNPTDRSVSWGEATTDEMCIAFLGVTFDGETLQ